MDTLFAALGRFVVRFRYVVVLRWIAAVALTGAAFPSLSSEIDNDNSRFRSAGAPSLHAQQLAAPLLGDTGQQSRVTIVADRSGGKITETGQAIRQAVTAMSSAAHVTAVHRENTSADGQAAQIQVTAAIDPSEVLLPIRPRPGTALTPGIDSNHTDSAKPKDQVRQCLTWSFPGVAPKGEQADRSFATSPLTCAF